VLPSLLEFLRGAVLVAHNAPYDVGFLKAACARHGHLWPQMRVLDTAALARRALTRDEVPNRKLATLAQFFHARVQPTHRALDDAKATVDVLHGLIERLGSFRVHTLGDAVEFAKAVTPTQRRQRHLADGLPHSPGVYVFRAADDRPLYVGTSKDIGTRVRSYFTASEKRARISEMLAAATRVEAVECAHSLEAEVRELRLIAAHSPPYNRRSKYPERVVWLKLTAEAYPRLSVVRALADDDAAYLGPFSSRRTAELAAAGVYDAVPLRQCTHKLSVRTPTPACALAELGRCPAPCEHEITVEEYAARAALPFRTATSGDPRPIVDALMARIEVLSARQRYEEAAVVRSRLIALLRATVRMQRLGALTRLPELVAARRDQVGGWRWAAGRSRWCGTAGWPPRPRRHPGCIHARRWTWRGRRPRRSYPDRGRCRPPRRRRRNGSWRGWNARTPDWWRLPATGCHRLVAPRASVACSAGLKPQLRGGSRPFAHR
jgi:DNA polymerase III subunit epsilon